MNDAELHMIEGIFVGRTPDEAVAAWRKWYDEKDPETAERLLNEARVHAFELIHEDWWN